jgi:hypothetical protein
MEPALSAYFAEIATTICDRLADGESLRAIFGALFGPEFRGTPGYSFGGHARALRPKLKVPKRVHFHRILTF